MSTSYAELIERLEKTAHNMSVTRAEDIKPAPGESLPGMLREAAAALAALTDWQPMETAPLEKPCYVIGRYTYATAGFPQEAMFVEGKWQDAHGTELVVWGWMPRPESWPDEPRGDVLSRDMSDGEKS